MRLVGRIASAHGIRGEVSVYPLTNDPSRFFDLAKVFVPDPGASEATPTTWEIEQVRIHKGRVLLKLVGLDDRTSAERLVGREVLIAPEDEIHLEEGEFYVESLIGLVCFDEAGSRIGVILAVEEIPGNPLISLRTEAGSELLVPFNKMYVSSVDVPAARLVLRDAVRGLLNPVEVR